ncbi:MAG TPA: sodium:solute symporter family protein [Synergistales bacterium]|nr:sodium:solute symporter family protein [Synergistales bacterium]
MSIFALSALSVMLAFMVAGISSGRRSGSHSEYTVAGRESGPLRVSGILLGSLVGGASTVGTVQMAYQWGLSAWWFTLGGGLGCLILGLWFAAPLRRSGVETIPGFLNMSFGKAAATVSVISSIAGTFISIVVQFISGSALLRGVFPAGGTISVLLVGVLVLSFIFTGGIKTFSSLGIWKIVVLYLTLVLCAGAAIRTFFLLPDGALPLPFHPFFNLFGQGLGKGLGAGLSLITGVMCTQIYVQAVFSASEPVTARKGALLSAFLMPPMGLMGIVVGLSLRRSGVVIESGTALSHFLATSFSPLVGGILWGVILVTLIGTAAGLTLGVATNLVCDLLPSFRLYKYCERNLTGTTRITVLVLVVLAGLTGLAGQNSMILKWSYLSMGLRASGTFLPLVAAVLAPGSMSPRWALATGSTGLLTTLLWPLTGLPQEPLTAGLLASAMVAGAGILSGRGSLFRPGGI